MFDPVASHQRVACLTLSEGVGTGYARGGIMVSPRDLSFDMTAPQFRLAEALRALGFWLQPGGTPQVWLTLDVQGIVVRTPAEPTPRLYTWPDLAAQARAQVRHRRRRAAPRPDPRRTLGWAALLRVVGRLLEARDIRQCEIAATLRSAKPDPAYTVTVTVDGKVVLDTEAVCEELARLSAQIGAAARRAGAARASWRLPWPRR